MLFGGDWASAILGLATFPIQTSEVVIVFCVCNVVGGKGSSYTGYSKEWARRGAVRVYSKHHVSSPYKKTFKIITLELSATWGQGG